MDQVRTSVLLQAAEEHCSAQHYLEISSIMLPIQAMASRLSAQRHRSGRKRENSSIVFCTYPAKPKPALPTHVSSMTAEP